jgi:dynein heavy chain
MFSDTYNFYKGYTISKAKRLEEIRAHIANLPNLDNPQAFGLHPNADITLV